MNYIINMTDQIEMSTAEAPAQNSFRQTVNFFGRPVPLRTTFTFGPVQPGVNDNKMPVNNNSSYRPVEVNTTWMPYNERMANSINRAETFISWPKQIVQKPDQMVSSGFYYTGRGDVVQCFYCGISLKHWSRTDVVDAEHRKHSPSCKFLVMARCK